MTPAAAVAKHLDPLDEVESMKYRHVGTGTADDGEGNRLTVASRRRGDRVCARRVATNGLVAVEPPPADAPLGARVEVGPGAADDADPSPHARPL